MNYNIKGPCMHINGITCDNCRPQDLSKYNCIPHDPFGPLKKQPSLLDHLITMSPKKEEPMTIEKAENGVIIKVGGKTYVVAIDTNNLSGTELGNKVVELLYPGTPVAK
jgi:hypothetical protein